VLEKRESLRLKLVETYVDAGLHKEAKSQLEEIDEASVSSIMAITRDCVHTRINIHLKTPNSEPASVQEGSQTPNRIMPAVDPG